MVKSMGVNDLMHLTMRKDGNGWALYLDDKKLHYVESYNIESSALPGAAELSLKITVKYP